nr:MAG TPA: hypothetical protein [Caudoviricetes sp.]
MPLLLSCISKSMIYSKINIQYWRETNISLSPLYSISFQTI